MAPFLVAALTVSPAMSGIVITNLPSPGTFSIRASGAPLQLSNKAFIEIQRSRRWVRTADVSLDEHCGASPAPQCMSLKAGATIRPVRWDGFLCSGQCGQSCKANPYAGPGVARLTVISCTQAVQYHGPPFILPRQPLP